MNTNNFDTYVKITNADNIYLGFVTKDTPIERGNKKHWTVDPPFYFNSPFNSLMIFNRSDKQDINEHLDKYYKINNTKCNWVGYIKDLKRMGSRTIHKVTDPEVALILFDMFHVEGAYKDLKDFQCSNPIDNLTSTKSIEEHKKIIIEETPKEYFNNELLLL